jgi:hypothetical protein
MAPALMVCWIEGGAGNFLFSVLPGGAVELPGRSRPAPGVVDLRWGYPRYSYWQVSRARETCSGRLVGAAAGGGGTMVMSAGFRFSGLLVVDSGARRWSSGDR